MHKYANLMLMKKIISATFFTIILFQSMWASDFKAMLGLNSSKYVFSSSTQSLEQQQKSGMAFGLGWAFVIAPKMKLEIEAVYGQKGAKVAITNAPAETVSGIYKNTSIGLPIFFKYQFKENASPYFAFGPEFGLITSHHLIFPESKVNYDLSSTTKKLIIAFNASLGYEIPFDKWGLFAEVRYNRWLSNFLDDPVATMKSESFVFLIGGIYYL